MKRCLDVLTAYSSSDEDESKPAQPLAKKTKLPALSSSLLEPQHIDDPVLHQGRVRTIPHVEGQFAAHVYVPLVVDRHCPLYGLICDVLCDARTIAPTLNDFWSQDALSKTHEFHISLSRPIFLRAHQREDLKKTVKALAMQCRPFKISFATFAELDNDERTRTFLALEVGAGHQELRLISEKLTPTLQTIRQRPFYDRPRFHASIAWALLDRSAVSKPNSMLDGLTKSTSPVISQKSPPHHLTPPPESLPEAKSPTIPHFPKHLVPMLNDRHGAKLRSTKTAIFDAEQLTLKIGKEVYSWRLSAL